MKYLLRYLAFALMVGVAFAQSYLPDCQGSDTTKWSNCTGTKTFPNGTKYVGEFRDGKVHRQGTVTFPDGSKYVGEFRDGKESGQGTYTFANGDKYVGEHKDGKYNGEGTLYSSKGSIINRGIWADNTFVRSASVQQATSQNNEIKHSNLPDCQGNDTTKWSNCSGTGAFDSGAKYVGEFKDGKMHGQGTLTFADGDKYVGEFKDGRRNGQGTLTFASGAKYVGESKDNKRNGQGIFTFADGDKYVGEFKDDKRNGQGTFTFASGNKYVGEFKDDERNGQGTSYSSNGSIINQGIWADNTFIRSATVQQATTPTVSLPSIGRRVALVVGNANYKIRPLKNPRNDADDISRSLRSSGFDVIDLRDASLQQMRNGVRQFGDRLINNDVGLVYYSGHGVEVKGRNYFIPVNADIMREDEVADQGLDVSLILEKMNTAGKGVNILIVDACRDDPFGRSFRSSSRGLAQMDAPRGTIIAYATSPGKVASDGDPRERNSPYTKNLIKAMQQPNKPIEQVFKEVRRAVQEETKNQQTPWENTSLSGDFYFKVQR